jgi:GST-like protein
MGGLGPMLGQLGFFAVRSKEKAPLAIHHFTKEADRLLGVLDRRLGEAKYLAGDDYTIADIAAYPWTLAATTFLGEALAESRSTKPELPRWLKLVGERPAVMRGMAVPKI